MKFYIAKKIWRFITNEQQQCKYFDNTTFLGLMYAFIFPGVPTVPAAASEQKQ